MEQEIKVSVYCLAYNHEQYIRDALEGFVNQITDFSYEVIVHDDASTDNTAAIIREYAEKHPNIIKPIFQNENQHSKGVKIIKTYISPILQGKYIAICEGDDYWTDCNKLQMQVDILEEHPEYAACVHQTEQLNCVNGEVKKICPVMVSGVLEKELVLSDGNTAYQLSSLVVRRKWFFNRPDFCYSIKGVGDYPLAIYLSLSSNVYFINRTMSVYRLYSNSLSWNSRFNKSKNKSNHYRNVIKMLTTADEYYEFKYHAMIEKVISKFEYRIKRSSKSIEIITNSRYRYWLKKDCIRKARELIGKFLRLARKKEVLK